VITGGAYGFEHVNVAEQRRDPNSLLNWMERIIRMRKEVPEIGDFTVLKARSTEILALRYDWRNNSIVIVHNFSAEPKEVWVDVGMEGEDGALLTNLLSGDHSTADSPDDIAF